MKRAAALVFVLLASACAPRTHYVWGNYENALYRYYQTPANPQPYIAALKSAVVRGDAAGRTAPGLHAEYGYMLLTQHHPRQAVAQFEAEKKLWPESGRLMDRMITVATGRGTGPSTRPGA